MVGRFKDLVSLLFGNVGHILSDEGQEIVAVHILSQYGPKVVIGWGMTEGLSQKGKIMGGCFLYLVLIFLLFALRFGV